MTRVNGTENKQNRHDKGLSKFTSDNAPNPELQTMYICDTQVTDLQPKNARKFKS